MSRRYYNNSDNEDNNSFEKEYLNIFKNDFLDDDEGDDDYNVVEDILTHKYNYDEKPFYLSIPKKEVNDVINDANLQDNLSIFSDKDNEYHFLSRKTHRNREIKENKNIINKQPSNLSNNDHLSIIENSSSNKLFNKQNLNISGISNINKKNDNNNENENIITHNNKNKGNKLYGNNHNHTLFKEKLKLKKVSNNSHIKNKNIKYNEYINNSFIKMPEQINNNNNLNSNINNINNNNPNNNNNIIINTQNNNNFNNMRYEYFTKIKDINQNKGLSQMDLIEKLLFLLKQYDFMLQLLIQNLMMTENKNLKFRCYTLLFSFYMAKQRVLENLKFPEFYVGFEFNEIFGQENGINNNLNFNNNKFQRLKLQLSFFQPPILEILPILVKFIIKRTFTREETIKILKDFFPFTNPLYFPISKKFRHSTYIPSINSNNDININADNNNANNNNNEIQSSGKKKMRKKFNYVDDSLLLLGIYFHGKKNYEIIKQLWLPQRSNEEIKHRIKNLVCQNAPLNIIKKYKTMNENPLNQKDFLKFLKV